MSDQRKVKTETRIEAKVDLKDQWVIVRKVEIRESPEMDRDIQVFGLTEGGHWLFRPEGARYDDRCLLPIAHTRDAIEQLDVWAMFDQNLLTEKDVDETGLTDWTVLDLDSHRGYWFWTEPGNLRVDETGRPWVDNSAPLYVIPGQGVSMRIAMDLKGEIHVDTSHSPHEGWTVLARDEMALTVSNWKV